MYMYCVCTCTFCATCFMRWNLSASPMFSSTSYNHTHIHCDIPVQTSYYIPLQQVHYQIQTAQLVHCKRRNALFKTATLFRIAMSSKRLNNILYISKLSCICLHIGVKKVQEIMQKVIRSQVLFPIPDI